MAEVVDYRWADRVAASACRRFGAMHLVDDARSEARIALWRCARAFDPAIGCTLQQYAQRRVFGAVVDTLRVEQFLPRRGYRADVLSIEAATNAMGISSIPKAEHIDVLRALSRVTNPRHRYVIKRRFFDDADGSEISRELGVNQSRVSQMTQQAFRAMRRSMRHN
jgi:RNA polymerase sigma factor (sigma-70 family)